MRKTTTQLLNYTHKHTHIHRHTSTPEYLSVIFAYINTKTERKMEAASNVTHSHMIHFSSQNSQAHLFI